MKKTLIVVLSFLLWSCGKEEITNPPQVEIRDRFPAYQSVAIAEVVYDYVDSYLVHSFGVFRSSEKNLAPVRTRLRLFDGKINYELQNIFREAEGRIGKAYVATNPSLGLETVTDTAKVGVNYQHYTRSSKFKISELIDLPLYWSHEFTIGGVLKKESGYFDVRTWRMNRIAQE